MIESKRKYVPNYDYSTMMIFHKNNKNNFYLFDINCEPIN